MLSPLRASRCELFSTDQTTASGEPADWRSEAAHQALAMRLELLARSPSSLHTHALCLRLGTPWQTALRPSWQTRAACLLAHGYHRGSPPHAAVPRHRALLISWGFSVFQRFVVNEPMLILVSKGMPILFTTEFCANVCGETVVNLLDLMVQGIVTCIKEIKTG